MGVGALWSIAWVAMLSVLLVVFVRQLRRSSDRPWPMIGIGVVIGLGVAGVALLTRLG